MGISQLHRQYRRHAKYKQHKLAIHSSFTSALHPFASLLLHTQHSIHSTPSVHSSTCVMYPSYRLTRTMPELLAVSDVMLTHTAHMAYTAHV